MSNEIVIAYDGSPQGEDALALGRVLADVLGAEILVVSVANYPGYLMDPESLDTIADEETRPLLAKAAERLAGLEVETRSLVSDSTTRALHDLAETEKPTAIVIGSSHRGPVGRVLLGDVGVSLLSGAPCAVAVAPAGYARRAGRGLLQAGVAYDGSRESRNALDAAISLCERVGATLSILTVATLSPYNYAAAFEVLSAEEYQSAERRHKQEVLDAAVEQLPSGLAVDHHLLGGDPAEALASHAGDLDLLVLGSRGFGPLRRALLGGVSSRLAQSAPCPLPIIPRGARAQSAG